ncbi:hypothetical protein [Pseudothermotoga sp.]|uniref:GGDEF domain-containing protein n=1 Tax=Pseudothermotoga sp. TaxID=2033661 RepID=UPI0031F6E75D
MRAYVDFSDRDTFDKICSAIFLSGGVVVSREIDADFFVGEKVHPFLKTVLVSSSVPEDLSNVIDVILPSQSLQYYLKKFSLIFCHFVHGMGLEDFLDEEIYKSHRYNFPLCVILLRLVNSNTHLLQRIYCVLKNQARESDKIFVYDAATIIIVLPYTDLDGAKIFARRILRRSRMISLGGKIPEIVVSVTQTTSDSDSIELLAKLEEFVKKAFETGQRLIVV